MKASQEILAVWHEFDGFPMETLTKAWVYSNQENPKQRDLDTMKLHRAEYGVTGNCFDLAIWLLGAFKEAGIEAYPIGSELGTDDAHAAIVAVDGEGRRYLCDLGDQWLQPILIDAGDGAYTDERVSGFFPAAKVQVLPAGDTFKVIYHRPNDKFSTQIYSTHPVPMQEFPAAADFSQSHVNSKPLLEVRLPWENETAHWEFFDWKSFLSTSKGLFEDPPIATVDEWVERIHEKSGYDKVFLKKSLEFFKGLGAESES